MGACNHLYARVEGKKVLNLKRSILLKKLSYDRKDISLQMYQYCPKCGELLNKRKNNTAFEFAYKDEMKND